MIWFVMCITKRLFNIKVSSLNSSGEESDQDKVIGFSKPVTFKHFKEFCFSFIFWFSHNLVISLLVFPSLSSLISLISPPGWSFWEITADKNFLLDRWEFLVDGSVVSSWYTHALLSLTWCRISKHIVVALSWTIDRFLFMLHTFQFFQRALSSVIDLTITLTLATFIGTEVIRTFVGSSLVSGCLFGFQSLSF